MLRLFVPGGESPGISEWFESELVPALSNRRRRPLRGSSVDKLRTAVGWWVRLMGNWPAADIGEAEVDEFARRLSTARWSRGPAGKPRDLSPWSVYSVVQSFLVVLNAGRAAEGLAMVQSALLRPVVRPRPAWSVGEARALVAAVGAVRMPLLRPARRVPSWWCQQAFSRLLLGSVLWWAHSGHRGSSVFSLRWSDVEGENIWVESSVKTGKPDMVPIHADLRAWMAGWLAEFGTIDTEVIFPWPIGYRGLADLHGRLVEAAGYGGGRVQAGSIQMWRRYHAARMAEAGISVAAEAARVGLGHSSTMITSGFYCDFRALLVPRLPSLVSRDEKAI